MISIKERERLDKLLGQLDSNNENTKAIAASHIAEMARRLRLTIPELCRSPAYGDPQRSETILAMREIVMTPFLLNKMTDWEQKFLRDVSCKYDEDEALSPKQKDWANKLIARADYLKGVHGSHDY